MKYHLKTKIKVILQASMAIVILVSCDQPQISRPMSQTNYQEFSNTSSDISSTNGTTEGNFDTTEETQDLGIGYSSCNLNYKRSSYINQSDPIVDISLCQNSNSETEIKVKFGDQDYSSGTCFVPMHKQANDESFYLGQAQCTTHGLELKNGSLNKSRQGYTDKAINTVMILKRDSVEPFFQCMDAIPIYLNSNQQCQGIVSTNCYQNPGVSFQTCSSCLQSANNFKTQKCNEFKYGHSYLEWAF
jgi:hypothetical protein